VADTDAEEVAEEHRRALLILNGPQAKGLAIEQDDVDAMFSAGSDQADIDKLFG
jgi:hypothetical protein